MKALILVFSFFLLVNPICYADWSQEWVDAHNYYRTKHGVPPVVWSDTVAASAKAWADTCPSGHSKSGFGENMAFAYFGMSPSHVTELWYNEEPLYDYNNPGWQYEAGHFTQVVWKNTREIGCALKSSCTSGWSNVWVCQYNPPGNVLNHFAANVFPPVDLDCYATVASNWDVKIPCLIFNGIKLEVDLIFNPAGYWELGEIKNK